MMFNFSDIHLANKNEQVRAWSVEQAIEFHRDGTSIGIGMTFTDLISLSKMIEDYITHGDVSNSITTAVDEGVREGRFEVKQEVEKWFANVDLDDLFRTKGWFVNEPQEGTTD